MFSLDRKTVKLVNVNPRTEKHGDENALACDLKFEIRASNDVLSEFHHSLKSALYKEPDQGNLIDEPGTLSQLKFPDMGPISYGTGLAGHELTIHYGISSKSDLSIDDCRVNHFRLHPQEGGTVIVTFRVQGNPSEHVIGKLCSMIQQDIDIYLTAPGESQLDLEAAALKGNGRKKTKLEAVPGVH